MIQDFITGAITGSAGNEYSGSFTYIQCISGSSVALGPKEVGFDRIEFGIGTRPEANGITTNVITHHSHSLADGSPMIQGPIRRVKVQQGNVLLYFKGDSVDIN